MALQETLKFRQPQTQHRELDLPDGVLRLLDLQFADGIVNFACTCHDALQMLDMLVAEQK